MLRLNLNSPERRRALDPNGFITKQILELALCLKTWN